MHKSVLKLKLENDEQRKIPRPKSGKEQRTGGKQSFLCCRKLSPAQLLRPNSCHKEICGSHCQHLAGLQEVSNIPGSISLNIRSTTKKKKNRRKTGTVAEYQIPCICSADSKPSQSYRRVNKRNAALSPSMSSPLTPTLTNRFSE